MCQVSAHEHTTNPGDEGSQVWTEVEQARPPRKYEILRHIASGGMGEIFLARARGLEGFERLVVVKQLLANLAADREFLEMFLDEARLAGQLHHANVVQVFDVDQMDGTYFFAMEYLHGADLRSMLRALAAAGRTVPLEHVIAVAIGACAGLHYAHEKTDERGAPLHVIHRDVSPQNIFVTFDGTVKLVDFGVAKAAHRLSRTGVGVVKGKLHYMSPEQVQLGRLDRRCDIYSLGVVLWELITGSQLHAAPTQRELLQAIVSREAPPPSSLRPECPRELDRIIARTLHRDREARYPTAEGLQLDLESWARAQRLPVSTIGLSRFMRELFASSISGWEAARREGLSLAEHVTRSFTSVETSEAAATLPLTRKAARRGAPRTEPEPAIGPPVPASAPVPSTGEPDATRVAATSPRAGRVGRGGVLQPTSRRWRRWLPITLGLASLAGIAALVAALWARPSPPISGSAATVPHRATASMTVNAGSRAPAASSAPTSLAPPDAGVVQTVTRRDHPARIAPKSARDRLGAGPSPPTPPRAPRVRADPAPEKGINIDSVLPP
jgi:serine/threonine protein kinase